ncbi:MAG: hypothetical protein N4A37_10620 [Prolixibacteraceae bacterium]|jgi:hypothetical protein|nr:hypothetical protein [Prolixibacteraceae bacterium]
MYTGFNLEYVDFLTPPQQKYYLNKGKELFKNYSNEIENNLDDLILKNGHIDGQKMQEDWFPDVNADVFLSHSHKNEKEAIALSGFLFEKLDIMTFVDSCIWGNSADLLKRLDKKFCQRTDGYYDYEKRNFTTSNVHMMLSTALTKMIDKIECLFFLNTPESISFKEGVRSSTLSPWIYSEIEISKLIRHKNISEYRGENKIVERCSKGHAYMSKSFQYQVDLDHLSKITQDDVRIWVKSTNKEEEYPLDSLYQLAADGITKNI